MKKNIIVALALGLSLTACHELSKVAKQLPSVILEDVVSGGALTQGDIGGGLRQALNKGITNQVSKLTSTDGFYKNDLVKIMLPEQLQVVDETLRKLGMGSLADQGIMAINRTAEDAVHTATPIFVNAVKEMSFTDAKDILMGKEDAATSYLKQKTNQKLYSKFNPVIKKSFSKVGADKIWSNLIGKYNSIPLIKKINPNLTDYVTNRALDGVFTMIKKEENTIRKNTASRSTDLLKKVFALQDSK